MAAKEAEEARIAAEELAAAQASQEAERIKEAEEKLAKEAEEARIAQQEKEAAELAV